MWRIDRKASYLEWTIFILCCVISVGHKKKLKNFKGEAFLTCASHDRHILSRPEWNSHERARMFVFLFKNTNRRNVIFRKKRKEPLNDIKNHTQTLKSLSISHFGCCCCCILTIFFFCLLLVRSLRKALPLHSNADYWSSIEYWAIYTAKSKECVPV